MAIRRTIWIAYDLGVRGDSSNLYAWLDERKAKECGDSLAVLNYEPSGANKAALRKDLQKAIEIDKRTRIYAI